MKTMKHFDHIESVETASNFTDMYIDDSLRFIAAIHELKESYRGHYYRVAYCTKSGIIKDRYFDYRADAEAFINRNWSSIYEGVHRWDV